MILYLSDNKDDLGQGTDMSGNTRPGEFLVKGVQNDKTYYVVLQQPIGVDDQGNPVQGDLSEPIAVDAQGGSGHAIGCDADRQ